MIVECADSCLNRYPPHLIDCPVLSHVLCTELADLVVEMLPEDCTESVEDFLELRQAQFAFASRTGVEVGCQLVQPGVDLLVLCEQLKFLLERGHFAREDREYVSMRVRRKDDSHVTVLHTFPRFHDALPTANKTPGP